MTVPSMTVDLSSPCGSMANLSPRTHGLSIPCGSATVEMPAEGCIDFRTTPPGASIYIDDVLKPEVTPAIICGLSLGTRNYRLVLPGYVDITGTVSLVTGHGEAVSGTFAHVAQAGFGAAGMFLIAGLGIGFLLLARKRR